MKATYHSGRTFQRGFSLAESLVASCVFIVSVIGVITGLNFGCTLAQRATIETTAEYRVTRRMEDMLATPYASISSTRYPVEILSITQSVGNYVEISLVYAISTTVTEVTAPVKHKRIDMSLTWTSYGGPPQYTEFLLIRAPVELKNPYLL